MTGFTVCNMLNEYYASLNLRIYTFMLLKRLIKPPKCTKVIITCPHQKPADQGLQNIVFLLVKCVLTPQSTAKVMSIRSLNLSLFFLSNLRLSGLPVLSAHTFACNRQQP